MKLLLYCTKAKPDLVDERKIKKEMPDNLFAITMKDFMVYSTNQRGSFGYTLNGKIVAECDFEVEEISRIKSWNSTEDYDWEYETPTLCYYDLLRKSCLMCDEFEEYIEFNGYAIHIKNLHIFDKPKDLSDCWAFDKQGLPYKITNAPQNMMKVNLPTFMNDDNYVLISIHSEWLCKILNGEKTIEVRKKVLKEMLE